MPQHFKIIFIDARDGYLTNKNVYNKLIDKKCTCGDKTFVVRYGKSIV